MNNINCCYLLANNITGDEYIGVTDNFDRRSKQHSRGSNKYLKEDIQKYGWNNFSIKKLFEATREYCFNLEDKLIKAYNCSKYNLVPGGIGNTNIDQSGEKNYNAKLTEIQVIEIRKKYSNNKITLLELSKLYNISFQEVSNIIRGKTWATVDGPIITDNSKNNTYKLNNIEVINIRDKYKSKNNSQKELAKIYGVSPAQISNIVRGISQANIKGPIITDNSSNNSYKLTKEKVLQIRELYSTKKYTLLILANKYNISFQHVSALVNGKRWKEAGGPIKGIE